MNIFSSNNLQKLYNRCGGILKKIKMQGNAFALHDEALEFLITTDAMVVSLKNVQDFMLVHEDNLRRIPRQTGKPTVEQLIESLDTAIKSTNKIKEVYSSHKVAIDEITVLKNSFSATVNEVRTNMETESFAKASDLRHKIYLTLLRAIQIPIFIFVTYWAIAGTVWTLEKSDIKSDLLLPFKLVPTTPRMTDKISHNLANSQKVSDYISTKPSATSETLKNTKSATSPTLLPTPQ